MTTLGKSLNVSQLSADPWEKFLRCCQAGFASCSFFFFRPQQFKRDNPTEWGKAFGPCPGSPTRGPINSRSWFLQGQDPSPLAASRPHRVPHRIFSIAHKGQGALRPQGDTVHKAAGRLAFPGAASWPSRGDSRLGSSIGVVTYHRSKLRFLFGKAKDLMLVWSFQLAWASPFCILGLSFH